MPLSDELGGCDGVAPVDELETVFCLRNPVLK